MSTCQGIFYQKSLGLGLSFFSLNFVTLSKVVCRCANGSKSGSQDQLTYDENGLLLKFTDQVRILLVAGSMDDNELLKSKFQKLHAELVGQNLSTVVDRLFAAEVISTANMDELQSRSGSPGWSSDKSRMLMTLLHRSHMGPFMG